MNHVFLCHGIIILYCFGKINGQFAFAHLAFFASGIPMLCPLGRPQPLGFFTQNLLRVVLDLDIYALSGGPLHYCCINGHIVALVPLLLLVLGILLYCSVIVIVNKDVIDKLIVLLLY